jgi:hypothetical protein
MVESASTNEGGEAPREEEEEATPSVGIGSARYISHTWPVMTLAYVNSHYHELFAVLRTLERGGSRAKQEEPDELE